MSQIFKTRSSCIKIWRNQCWSSAKWIENNKKPSGFENKNTGLLISEFNKIKNLTVLTSLIRSSNLSALFLSSRSWRGYKLLHTQNLQFANASVNRNREMYEIWFGTHFYYPTKVMGRVTLCIFLHTFSLTVSELGDGMTKHYVTVNHLELLWCLICRFLSKWPDITHLLIPSYDNDCIQII